MDLAAKLAYLGVREGDHVGILSDNQIPMVSAIHALSYLGAVGVLLNTRLTPGELNYQLEDASVTILLTSETFENKAHALLAREKLTFSKLSHLPAETFEPKTELALDDAFTIMYTSGTTGMPKGVIHTYGNHWWSAIGSALNLGIQSQDKWLIPLPVFHVSGLSAMIKSVIYGMPVYLLEKFNEEIVDRAIREKQVTIASVVTLMVQRLLASDGDVPYPDTFRCMLLGGGPAPRTLLERAKEQGIPVFQSYGMTETSSQIATLSPGEALRKIGSAGKALFPAQLKVDADSGQVGEILVKGPMVTKGYHNNELANEKSFHDGWMSTGDLGYLDEDGFLYVVDRRKDLIISGGENIYPSEVEAALLAMEGILEAGVRGKPDDKWGQVPVAYIVTDREIGISEIRNHLEACLAKYKHPKEIHLRTALPRNASNKLVRSKLS